jgi:hypothetical protein
MNRVVTFILGIATGVVLCFGATNYHIVRANDGFHLVHKQRSRMSETYVDVRSFGVEDWSNRTELAAELVADNKQYVMGDAVASGAVNRLSQFPNLIGR